MKLLKGILLGFLVSLGGWVFAALFANFFNGLDFDSAVVAGFVVYLIIVVVACAYLLYQQRKEPFQWVEKPLEIDKA